MCRIRKFIDRNLRTWNNLDFIFKWTLWLLKKNFLLPSKVFYKVRPRKNRHLEPSIKSAIQPESSIHSNPKRLSFPLNIFSKSIRNPSISEAASNKSLIHRTRAITSFIHVIFKSYNWIFFLGIKIIKEQKCPATGHL